MFAVKGWSVSADKLKPETSNVSAKAEAPKSKKRKRPSQAVTATNVAELWSKVIDKKETPRQAAQIKHQNAQHSKEAECRNDGGDTDGKSRSETKRQKKKQKRLHESDGNQQPAKVEQDVNKDEEWGGLEDAPEELQAPAKESANLEKATGEVPLRGTISSGQNGNTGKRIAGQDNSSKKHGNHRQDLEENTPGQVQSGMPAASANPVKLTPLQASMRKKLVSARFRHLNETLYTKPSAEAFAIFKDSPEMFAQYHEGFRRQVDVWPENPVDSYIMEIKARAKVRFFGRNNTLTGIKAPLPRSDGKCTIADLGCGDAALAAAIQPLARKLHVEVKSFDLQSTSPLVTRADIANLPLAKGTIDVAIFCLALMGTNWVDFVEEAYRVLRWKGELWVAEIKSRFTTPGAKKRGVVEHSIGNRRKSADGKKGEKKGREQAEDAATEAALAVEVDGAEDQRRETDVSAFVEVLWKRGFVLRGDPAEAVDLSNKMFVKMSFVKAAPATKGKCAATGPGEARSHGKMKKFLGDDDDEGVEKEASVLKPCVYKIR